MVLVQKKTLKGYKEEGKEEALKKNAAEKAKKAEEKAMAEEKVKNTVGKTKGPTKVPSRGCKRNNSMAVDSNPTDHQLKVLWGQQPNLLR